MKNSDSPNEAPRILVFPQDQTNWRVDWFGDVAFPDRAVKRKHPSVFVYLSRVIDAGFVSDPSVLLSPRSTTPTKLQKRVWVSVGMLVLIRIGDIWRNGQLVFRPDYQLETFKEVQIEKSTTWPAKAGHGLRNAGFLLPEFQHPWHMQCTKSNCVVVDLPQNRRIVVPCLELVRFYFGSSSDLLSKLFSPPLLLDSLFSKATQDTETKELRINLGDRIRGASAADIGRIATDPVAAHAARIVGASCLRASMANETIYPLALFPFEGKTDLVAAGKWLTDGTNHKSTFLVYNLRSCSYPFPFLSLQFTTRGLAPKPVPQYAAETNASFEAHRERIAKKRAAAAAGKPTELVEADPSGSLARKTWTAREAPRFVDLEEKQIWKSDKVLFSAEVGVTGVGRASSPVTQAAVGDESGSNRRVRPLDLEIVTKADANEKKSAPLFLKQTVQDLSQLQGITVELLTESQDDGWTLPIPVLADEDGEIRPELMISEGDDLRMRRAAVFALKQEMKHVNAVFIEADPIYKTMYESTDQETEVSTTLKRAAAELIDADLNEAQDRPLLELITSTFGRSTFPCD